MRLFILSILVVTAGISVYGQKKVLDHSDFEIWNVIQNPNISTDGQYILYSLERGEADQFLRIKDNKGELVLAHDRAESGKFSYDSKHAAFLIKAWTDSLKDLKRRKVKKDKMPNDTLGIISLSNKSLTKIPHHQSHKLPQKWGGYIAYQVKPSETKPAQDTTKNVKKIRKQNKDNGYHLILRNLSTAKQDTFKYVTHYIFAEKDEKLAFVSTGDEENENPSVYVYDLEVRSLLEVFSSKGKYSQLSFSENGKHLAFLADRDTTKTRIRPYELYHWTAGGTNATLLMDNSKTPDGYLLSDKGNVSFSENESRLFFGLAEPPILQDTSILEEEIVNVEVWTYNEPRLYTVQELQVNRDRNKTYTTMVDLDRNNAVIQIESPQYPDASFTRDRNESQVLLSSSLPYQLESQWLGASHRDYALLDINSGTIKPVLSGIRGRLELSPAGKYISGYDENDSTWFTYSVEKGTLSKLTEDKVFYNELNDSPDLPNAYGRAGWTQDDTNIILYDRYDIWKFNPENGNGTRMTQGRESQIVYRYLPLDREITYIEEGKWLLSQFNEKTKDAGYAELNSKNNKLSILLNGPYRYSRPVKAEGAKGLMYTRQSFVEFPDIRFSDTSFKNSVIISNANPQQKDYNWGTAELISWTSLDGIELEGMLIKPENFDPSKKYPLLVNFYERSSDGLHGHRAPSPGRSTINYSFYTSRGYVIFNPDIQYKIGYPGESAYNCVVPGVTHLIDQGFIDKDRMGLQGHSWGGYQIAYMVTRTNMFRAAEAGAPVPNMISAYGGIRWWTGLSRQFQYEHTQSRIGGTPWEYPTRYFENSPIFFIDKIQTPLLIMHNDADGHVPWYQGIEFFVSLRRLGKPSWMLNYNGEPHWPLKRQNRLDFNIRMQQFFDYYLKDAAKPKWMEEGVPAIQKGINQNYELMGRAVER